MPPTKRKMHPFNLDMFLVSCNLLGMLLGNCNKNYAFYANSDNYNFKCSCVQEITIMFFSSCKKYFNQGYLQLYNQIAISIER